MSRRGFRSTGLLIELLSHVIKIEFSLPGWKIHATAHSRFTTAIKPIKKTEKNREGGRKRRGVEEREGERIKEKKRKKKATIDRTGLEQTSRIITASLRRSGRSQKLN